MKTRIVKLRFSGLVHFGRKRLTDGERVFAADTFFSSLFIEAVALSMDTDWLLQDLVLSDAFPYIGEQLYLPKPLIKFEAQSSDETNHKLYKKLNYIPVSSYHRYLQGEINPEQVKIWQEKFELGTEFLMDKVSLSDTTNGGDSRPYGVGSYAYGPDAGVYLILQAEDVVIERLKQVLDSLQYSGIGGKRSSGYGRFQYELMTNDKLVELLNVSLGYHILLSTAMTKEPELSEALSGARYLLKKRSGFVQSTDYEQTLVKKKDFYSFVPGSVFQKAFSGEIFDVGENGGHPIYRYAKAIWLGVS